MPIIQIDQLSNMVVAIYLLFLACIERKRNIYSTCQAVDLIQVTKLKSM